MLETISQEANEQRSDLTICYLCHLQLQDGLQIDESPSSLADFRLPQSHWEYPTDLSLQGLSEVVLCSAFARCEPVATSLSCTHRFQVRLARSVSSEVLENT